MTPLAFQPGNEPNRWLLDCLAVACIFPAVATALPRAAIFCPNDGVGSPGAQAATPAVVFERELSGLYETERLDERALEAELSRDRYDLLVVPTGSYYPEAATNSLVGFLRKGGNLFTCGGYAFGQVKYMTTHDAPEIRDCLLYSPMQIGAFDPSHDLRSVAKTRTVRSMAGILPDVEFEGDLRGYSAVGVLSDDGHGFGPNCRSWHPVLECRDESGLRRGYAGSLICNVSGVYRGSSWAVFGVTNLNLFSGGCAAKLIRPIAENLSRRMLLGLTTSDYACYRVGETMELSCAVVNSGNEEKSAEVVFSVAGEEGALRVVPFVLQAGASTNLTARWMVPQRAEDFVRFSAELRCGGRPVARELGAFVVWDERVQSKGPRVTIDGLGFRIGGVKAFHFGAQTFWGQLDSTTARSPLKIDEDFRTLRKCGFRFVRLFMPMRTEMQRRFSDAVVQLAQKHGLVVYHTPNLPATSDPEKLAYERSIAAEIARRYPRAPGLMMDICNEPQFNEGVSETSMRKMRYWADECRRAAKKLRPELPVSIGWMQRWGDCGQMFDPPFVSTSLDFTDQHYYGPLKAFSPEFKESDLRALGKPCILGECGGKNHPSFVRHDPWCMGETDSGFCRRFAYLALHAFGLGGAALSCWTWRDPMEGVFPCGLVRSDGVARDAFEVMRSLMSALEGFEPLDNRPDVVISLKTAPRMRKGRMSYVGKARRVAAELRWWGANWSTLDEGSVADAKGVKLILDPDSLPNERQTLREALGVKLRKAGAQYTRCAGDDVKLITFCVSGRGMKAWVFWNDGEHLVETKRDGALVKVSPGDGSLVIVSDDGCVLRRFSGLTGSCPRAVIMEKDGIVHLPLYMAPFLCEKN